MNLRSLLPSPCPAWLKRGSTVGIRFFNGGLKVGTARVVRRGWSTAHLDNGLRVALRASSTGRDLYLALAKGGRWDSGQATGLVTAAADPVFRDAELVVARKEASEALNRTFEAFTDRPTRSGADALVAATTRFAKATIDAGAL